jgi:hypothetical protein
MMIQIWLMNQSRTITRILCNPLTHVQKNYARAAVLCFSFHCFVLSRISRTIEPRTPASNFNTTLCFVLLVDSVVFLFHYVVLLVLERFDGMHHATRRVQLIVNHLTGSSQASESDSLFWRLRSNPENIQYVLARFQEYLLFISVYPQACFR